MEVVQQSVARSPEVFALAATKQPLPQPVRMRRKNATTTSATTATTAISATSATAITTTSAATAVTVTTATMARLLHPNPSNLLPVSDRNHYGSKTAAVTKPRSAVGRLIDNTNNTSDRSNATLESIIPDPYSTMSPAVETQQVQSATTPLNGHHHHHNHHNLHHGGEYSHHASSTEHLLQQQPPYKRPRTVTTTEEIDSTIIRPGSVKINVKGAFIVDPDTSTPANPSENGRLSPAHETSDIRLPNHTAVVSHIAVDIGGSLVKLVYFTREINSTDPGGRLNFQKFETDRIDDCCEFMKHLRDKQLTLNGSRPGELCVMATGGGAYKFYDRIRQALGVDVYREDEMECLIIGLDFFITEIPREVFTYSETDPMHFEEPRDAIYPYLLVNIGSGVSFLKVTGPRSYQRVGGTSLGGGTLWGLLSLLTGARSFDDMLAEAEVGDNTKVDMMVGDIYGADYGKIGLKSTAIASSFGKVFRMKLQEEAKAEAAGSSLNEDPDVFNPAFTSADISRSLLYAVSNNIGQIAYLQSQIHNLSDIYFGGSFIRGHRQTMNTLSYAIKFWSKGEKQAYFLRHEGYLGAVGAFLKKQPMNWGRRGSLEGLDELQEWRKTLKKETETS